jgi:endoglucanase
MDHKHEYTSNESRIELTEKPISSATRRDILKASAGAGAVAAGLGTGIVGSAAAGIPTPWLHRDGNLIRDPSGNKVVLRGINTADVGRVNRLSEWRGKNIGHVIDLATNESKGWYTRAIRLPCQQQDINTAGGVETYVDKHLIPAVERCKRKGVYAIVDYHRITGYDGEQIDSEVRNFWNHVAPLFADESHVIYEVFNEPTTPFGWGQSITEVGMEHWQLWKETAQPWVDLIRRHAPQNLILIGSPRWSQYTRFAAQDEFEGDNLAYVFHCYTQFEGPGDCPDCWGYLFGNASREIPIFITEWGYANASSPDHHFTGTTSGFGQKFKDYINAHDAIHWQAWCFDMNWEPMMFQREFTGGCPDLPCGWKVMGGENWEGEFIQRWLAETRNDDLPGGGGGDRDTSSPPTPSDLTITATTDTSITIDWSTASDSGGSGLDHYVVSVDGKRAMTVPAGTTQATVTDLSANTSYTIRVRTVDGAGNTSSAVTMTVVTDASGDVRKDLPSQELVVNDYDGSPAWPGQNDLGNWCAAGSFENSEVVNGALVLEYDNGGWFVEQVQQDVSEYNQLVFRLRGASGGEGDEFTISVGGVTAMFDTVADSTITTDYSTVAIDMTAAGIDTASVGELRLNFWQGGTGALSIDEIYFI